jgi:hypothetical protein
VREAAGGGLSPLLGAPIEPAFDIAAAKAPFADKFKAGDVAAADQPIDQGGMTAQEVGQFAQSHDLARIVGELRAFAAAPWHKVVCPLRSRPAAARLWMRRDKIITEIWSLIKVLAIDWF